MATIAQSKPGLVVVGNGMVGHRFLQEAVRRGLNDSHRVVAFAEEGRRAYDRVNLSKFFDGKSAEDLSLVLPREYEDGGVEVLLEDAVVSIDRDARFVHTASGKALMYETLVLATGSRPFVPEIPGRDAEGCFVYRTIVDLMLIREYAARSRSGVVIGGGLLGLEAAGALKALGLETHVIEFAPRLMPLQVDEVGGMVLRQRIEDLGVKVHVERTTAEIMRDEQGRVTGLRFSDGSELESDMVVFSAGIRARDELARAAGLALGDRGGVAIDAACRTSDPHVFAIGECASFTSKTYGLVAPGYRMAEVAAAVIAGEDARFEGFDMSTKLKLLGVDVGSFGDAFARTPGARIISLFDSVAGVYKKIVLSAD
jgi:nitrite reductase (NADH) large subunit